MVEPAPNLRPRYAIALLTLALHAAVIVAAVFITNRLEKIPNDPASVDEYIPTLNTLFYASVALLAGAISMAFRSKYRPAQRAVKYTAIVCAASFLLWYAPVPFGVHRYLLYALILAGAAFFLLAGLRTAWSDLRGRPQAPWWTGPILALAAFSAAAATLLLIKSSMIWWAYAVD